MAKRFYMIRVPRRAWLVGLGLAVGIILAAGGSAGADPLKPSCSSVTGGTNVFLDDEIGSYRDRVRAAEKRRADDKYPDIVRNRSPDAPGVDHGPPQVIVTGGHLTPVEERLLELRRNLDSLLLKYPEEHPDVKAARQAIAQLQAEGTKSSSGGPGQPGNAATKGQTVSKHWLPGAGYFFNKGGRCVSWLA